MTSKKVVAASLEDDQLVIADGTFEWTGEQHTATSISKLKAIPRRLGPGSVEDDQGSVASERIFEHVRDYAFEHIDGPVDVFALSMFGTVSRSDQVINHVPNRGIGQGRVIKIDFPSFIKSVPGYQNAAVVVDNDATAAALGEHLWGAGAGSDAFAYIWAGRGINAGLILGQNVWEGKLHPEAGHCIPRRHPQDMHAGNCVIHGDCILGLASLRSVLDRRQAGVPEDQIRAIIASYYAQLCLSITLITAPDRIVIGGYLLRADVIPGLIDEVRLAFSKFNNSYPDFTSNTELGFIAEGKCGGEVSILGMIEMARRHLDLSRINAAVNDGATNAR